MKTALPRTTFLAIGIAAVGLFATSQAFAGQKEIDAIQAELDLLPPANDTVTTASSTNLSTATLNAIGNTVNKKLSPTTIAGEALKGASPTNASDFGTVFGAAAFASADPRISGDKNKFAAGASVSASTGKTANATQVPTFAGAFFTDNDGAQLVARLATKSSTAIGAILGGRSLQIAGNDAAATTARVNLANSALQDGKTAKAAQEIAQFISRAPAVDDAQASVFATTVAVANSKFLQKVAVGTTASNPNSASGTIAALTASSISATVLKQAPKLAKSVGLVADIEQIQLMAVNLGGKVAANAVNSTAKALIQAISGRAPSAGTSDTTNRGDEVGEIAAYYLAALQGNTALTAKFGSAKSAASLVFGLAKTMFKAAKVKNIKGTQTPTALQVELTRLPGNFAASFALTLKALNLPTEIFDAIVAKLTSPGSLKAIGGKAFADALGTQFAQGLAASTVPGESTFENGKDFTQSMIDAPETDIRNG